MTDFEENSSVRVAVRIRPQLPREKIDNCRICTSVTVGEPQVVLGNDKAFTFDKVFDVDATQNAIFQEYAKQLIEGCLNGYNATILAYGQTGSGKTYSMGTGFDINGSEEQVGIIPRAVQHLFEGIQKLKQHSVDNSLPMPAFQVVAQFLELYNEDIYDLFDSVSIGAEGKRSKSNVKIHEDSNGSIYTQGVAGKLVTSYHETMECLRAGALSRTTASTNMNSQSSRSHAIFTLLIKQTRSTLQLVGDESKDVDTAAVDDFETLTAKFNFVDLAGSERLKRTGATGDRAKEGISINCGLLALGNVISALGDATKKGSHVPYRDSKLTRLLQDSLGGNSRTVMIACISPSDRDFMETLNTLKYANRARNIKNKVVLNQDKTSKQLTELRLQIQSLQVELAEYKQGKRMIGPDGVESINDMFHENSLLQGENEKLRCRVKALQKTVDSLTSMNVSAANDKAAVILSGLSGDNINEEMQKLVAGYTCEIEQLKTKLIEYESMGDVVSARNSSRHGYAVTSGLGSPMTTPRDSIVPVSKSMENTMSIIELAKQDVERSRKNLISRQNSKAAEDEAVEKIDSGGGSGGDEDSGEPDNEESYPDDDLSDEEGEDDGLVDGISSESDESDRESDHLQEDLAELTGEISLKQRMIEELEKSQRQLHNIRQHYEDKLQNLQEQIKAIERERDQVLNSLGSKKQQSEEQVQKVKSEYEKRLSVMQTELSKVNAAKKEHAKMMKNQIVYDKKIKELSLELSDMKKVKVRLMAQMKTDSEKNKLNDQKKSRELIQLKKEKRIQDNQVRMLQLQNKQKDVILKRKHEEVSQLRKKQREATASSRVAAKHRINSAQRVGAPVKSNKSGTRTSSGYGVVKPVPPFSPKNAKNKWDKLEHYVTALVMKKQTISSMEAEMDMYIKKREELSKRIEEYNKRLDRAVNKNQTDLAMDLEDQLETMATNMKYLHSNVAECQNNIMQMEEEAKGESALSSIMKMSSIEESEYLLEHLLSHALTRGYECSQKEAQYNQLMARYEKMHMDSRVKDQLLEQVLQDSGITLQMHQDSAADGGLSGETSSSSRSSPISGDLMTTSDEQWADSSVSKAKSRKARRRTSTPAEMLLGLSDAGMPPSLSSTSLLGGKPTINITDIIPPAPKGPPPSQGFSSPTISTILEEDELADSGKGESVMIRSDSYVVLNSTVAGKPEIPSSYQHQLSNGDMEVVDIQSSSGTCSPDHEIGLDSNRLLAGSYTILNGEIRLDSEGPGSQGDHTEHSVSVETKKVPPPVPPKPNRPTVPSAGLSTGSSGMNKWKGVVCSHLDDVTMPLVDGGAPKAESKSLSNSNAGGDHKIDQTVTKDTSSRVVGRRKLASGVSPFLRRKSFQPSLVNNREKSLALSPDIKEVHLTPPSSPSLNKRRQLPVETDSSNVFMRLTNTQSTSTNSKKLSAPGSIAACDRVTSSNQSMVCVKKAKGHNKAVLSICASEELIFSGSKDLTCKIWDLGVGSELMSLEDHPNYVTRVRYCNINKLVYTVSNSFVKIWDIRAGPKCVKVLSSSGLVHESVPVEPASSSQAIIQQGEQQIFDIQVGCDGSTLYTTTGTTVRVWDLRMYSAVGKIASGHQAPIICLSIHHDSQGTENLITGSKDHLIKLFDLSNAQSSNCLVQPKFTLAPPHYDGVQCLAHRGNTLFSGSRDMCIKKWHLNGPTLQPQSVNGAHRDWVLDMCMLPDNDVLLSCCRSGYVKLWSTDTCNQLDEVRAHTTSVNSLATNSKNVFTASSDCTVKIWSVDSRRLAVS